MFRLGRFTAVLAAGVFVALLSSPTAAADDKKDKGPGKDLVVMGCLTRGDQPGDPGHAACRHREGRNFHGR